MKKKIFIAAFGIIYTLSVFLNCSQVPENYLDESKQQIDTRMEWWRDARFGMFIHWGIYSVPAGIYQGESGHAEWIMETAKIPVSEYEKYASQFNPVKFNALEWVQIAKDAGMKINGEAIYASRRMKYFKEGESIHFTQSKNGRFIYAITSEWPGETINLKSVIPDENSQIFMLGVKEPLNWQKEKSGNITIKIPKKLQNENNRPCKYAFCFRIEGTAAQR